MSTISQDVVVVVADGSKAMILQDELSRGSRAGVLALQQTNEVTSAKQLNDKLYEMKHASRKLVLVADPQILEEIRERLHKTASDIVLTTALALTDHPDDENAELIGRST